MAINSNFPETIMYDGMQWRLVYDPNCTDTVMPSINERDVQSVTMDTVQFPGRPAPIWLIMVNITIPESSDGFGKKISARRMIGFRTRDQQPLPSYKVRPNELVYYAASQADGSAAQRFFNAVTVLAHVPASEPEQPDTSWTQMFAQPQPQVPAADTEVITVRSVEHVE